MDVIPSSMFGPVLPHFIGSMVTNICWNDRTNMLAAMKDKFVVWYHPAVVYTDKEVGGGVLCVVCSGWGCMCVVCMCMCVCVM